MFFSVQFTVILVNAKVYLAKFQKNLLFAKVFSLNFAYLLLFVRDSFSPGKVLPLKHFIFTLRTWDVNWTFTRRSEDVLAVCLTSYVRSIYVLCLGGSNFWVFKQQYFFINFKIFVSIAICFFSLCRWPLQELREFHVKPFFCAFWKRW